MMSKPLGAFVALTFAISWAIWLAMVAGSVSIETTVGLALNVVAAAGPSIAALILAVAMGRGELQRLLAGFSLTPSQARGRRRRPPRPGPCSASRPSSSGRSACRSCSPGSSIRRRAA